MKTSPSLGTPIDGMSLVRGSVEAPLSSATVHDTLAEAVRRWPQRDAVVFVGEGVRWTWAQLQQQVEWAAAGLWRLGVRSGDRVGIWSPNRSEWLVTQFATARIGAILVNINPAYRLAELEYALNKAGVSVLVSAAAFKTSNYLGMLQNLGVGPDGHSDRLPHLKTVVRLGQEPTAGMLNWHLLLDSGVAHADGLPSARSMDCHEAINIQFTSGTTGAPKGATLTHHNIVNNARAVAACMRFTEHDSLCIPVPLYHCFGMVLAVLACVSTGA